MWLLAKHSVFIMT